jgi:hypothetical protein
MKMHFVGGISLVPFSSLSFYVDKNHQTVPSLVEWIICCETIGRYFLSLRNHLFFAQALGNKTAIKTVSLKMVLEENLDPFRIPFIYYRTKKKKQ